MLLGDMRTAIVVYVDQVTEEAIAKQEDAADPERALLAEKLVGVVLHIVNYRPIGI